MLAHRPIARAGRCASSRCPICACILPGLLIVLGFVGLVELTSFLTIGAAQGKTLVLFGNQIDVHARCRGSISAVLLFGGGFWFRVKRARFGGSGSA